MPLVVPIVFQGAAGERGHSGARGFRVSSVRPGILNLGLWGQVGKDGLISAVSTELGTP